jgi:predicted RNA-binding protein with PIN domain
MRFVAGRLGLLSMRWLIDGMNVIGTRPDAWWRDRHAAMVRLVDMLERWVAVSGEDVTVVFEKPPSPPIRSSVIAVKHAPRPRRDAADDEIVRLLLADPEPGTVRVVTSDLWLTDRVHAAGASVEAAAPFRTLIEDA